MANELTQTSKFILYTSPNGDIKLDVFIRNETLWLTQKMMAELFDVEVPAVSKHLANIFDSGELEENSVVSILETTASDGKIYKTKFYNLDAVIAVGYRVWVEARRYDYGYCTCYLGANGTLCKHMVALAIYVVADGKPLSVDDKKLIQNPTCSGRLGNLSRDQLLITKQAITTALRYIKPYVGPSRTWFAYQNSLSEGCNRLSAIVSDLPVSSQTAELLVDLFFRLDRKLRIGGVDDSDGTVGGFIEEVVAVLQDFSKLDPSCVKAFDKLKNRDTCFGWEEPLLKIGI